MTSNRVTVILGAGAAIDIGGPTTLQLTKKVKDININIDGTTKDYFVKEVAEYLENYYNNTSVNFEEIFNAIEKINSYMYAWGAYKPPHNTSGQAKLFKPSLGAFVTPTIEATKFFQNGLLGIIEGSFISEISELISKYDEYFKKNTKEFAWYSTFWNNLSSTASLDIATLNYDTCLESITEFNDGFNSQGKFSPKLLEEVKTNRILNLHGSIKYAYPRLTSEYQYYELVKCRDYKSASILNSNNQRQHQTTQGNEFVITGPLLMGLSKIEKIQTIPYVFYNAALVKNIIHNPSLLIIGYSFGDIYLNEIISNFINIHKGYGRLVFITKFPHNVLDNPIAFKDGEYGNAIRFINSTVFGNGGIPACLPVTKSSDGMSTIYFNGFKDAVINHTQEIIDFLKI